VHIILFDYGSNIGRYFLNEMRSAKSSFGILRNGIKWLLTCKRM